MAQVGEFAQLDLSDNPRYFIEFLDMLDRIPKMKEVRHGTYKAMDLAHGSHVLDVGCGHGTAAIEMARLVGDHGKTEGVDGMQARSASAASFQAVTRGAMLLKQLLADNGVGLCTSSLTPDCRAVPG